MSEKLTIALYKNSTGAYSSTYIKTYDEDHEYWEENGYVRVSELTTVDFQPRDQAVIDKKIVEGIDKEIAETVVKYEEKLKELKSRKALLVALPQAK